MTKQAKTTDIKVTPLHRRQKQDLWQQQDQRENLHDQLKSLELIGSADQKDGTNTE